ncbi:MAG: ABC transporter permease, partial [Opitutae bacterium]|nr:ABC transporter permease [Opitutae bacterium]
MFKLNPLTKKKFLRFRSIKRGYWSFVFLMILYAISLMGELFVNKRALIVSYEGEFYFPTYGDQISGKKFGLDYEYETNYRDLQKKFERESSPNWLLMPIVPFDPYEMDYANESSTGFSPPSFTAGHFCGTDKTERDVFARLLYGFRIAMTFSLGYLILTYLIAICVGSIMGYFG